MDPVAFSIFGIDIMWYSILITTGVIIGTILALREAERLGIGEDNLIDMLLIAIPLAVIGARLYYVIFSWDYYSQNPKRILHFREGGLAIHGAIIVAIIVAIIFSRKKGLNFWTLGDCCAPSLILGQGIGRWGNYINQEAYGRATNLPWGIMINGEKVHPTFLYESLGDFIIFFFLMWYRKNKQEVEGEVFLLYIIGYSTIRFFIEGLRTDSLMLGPIRVAQLVSVIGVVGGIAYLRSRRQNKKI